MKIWEICFIVIIGVLLILPVFGENESTSEIKIKPQWTPKAERLEYVPDEILIKFREGIATENIESVVQAFNLSKISEIKKFGIQRLKIPFNATILEIIEKLKKNPLVEFAEPNYIAYASMIPNDPYYSYQWHLDNPTYGGIQMEQAWDITTGTSSVVVAVVDTGIAYENYPAPAHCHIDTYRAYGGTGNSWWCGLNNLAWATPPGYGNGWKDYLQHSFDLTTATGTVTFSYQYRYHLERNYDYAYLEISSDGGSTWTQLKSYTGPASSSLVKWRADSADLTSYKGKNILIRFRVYSDEIYSDEDGYFNSDGALFVDEIKITHGGGTLFYDNVESGPGAWETTKYQKAPDLAGTLFVAGYDFVNNDAHANDDEGHGTHVAGTIAQTTNNNLGVASIAFNTTVMPVKVLSATGLGTYEQVANGIIYAVDNGADIISMSLGGSSLSSTLESAVNYAYSNGATVIAACGNSNTPSCDYPAAYDKVIAVGATQYDETKAPYSSYGSTLDLVAPGGNTDVDQNGDGYADGVLQQTFGDTPVDWGYWFYQGTSMATPHVSGVAALLLAVNSSLTPDQIRDVLQSTAEDLGTPGRDNTFGWGLIDASAAVNKVMPGKIISTTLIGYPIDFGNQNPGVANVSALGNPANQYIIRVNPETNVNVNISQKGDDYISGSNVMGIENMTWSKTNNVATSQAIRKVYDSVAANILPGTDINMYYWLGVPTVASGIYSATLYLYAIEA